MSRLATLKRRSQFQRVRGGGRWSTPAFVLEGKRRDAGDDPSAATGPPFGVPRFGFTVTKKLGNSVRRSRIRRRGFSVQLTEAQVAGRETLLTRLELADRLAEGGYGLSLMELAQLVEQPLKTLEARTEPWRWRDWQVQPSADGRWRLAREASGSVSAEQQRDG